MGKCWKCGGEISGREKVCPYCGADQRRVVPGTVPGQALRKLYDRFGADAVLTNPALLANGFGDMISDPLAVNVKSLKNQIRLAINSGVGELYLGQLALGQPDGAFDEKVTELLRNAGLNEEDAGNLKVYFDEMIGWRTGRTSNDIPDIGMPAPAPEMDEPVTEISRRTDSGQTQIDLNAGKQTIYENAKNKMQMGTLGAYQSALTLLQQIPGYRDANSLANLCSQKIRDLDPANAVPVDDQKHSVMWPWIAGATVIILLAIVYFSSFRFTLPWAKPTATPTVVYVFPEKQGGVHPTNTPVIVRPAATSTDTPVPVRPTATSTNTPVPVRPTATATKTPVIVRPTNTPLVDNSSINPTPTVRPTIVTPKPSATPIRVPTRTPSPAPSPAELYKLGIQYHNNQDRTTARTYFEQAANQGYAPAQSWLGYYYQEGYGGLSKSDARAVSWYQKAAEGGWGDAQYRLGFMYQYGLGTSFSYSSARSWYTKAVQNSNTSHGNLIYANTRLGELYYEGWGVSKNVSTARDYFLTVINLGYENSNQRLAVAEAQRRLGISYEVAGNYSSAKSWYDRAQTNGDGYVKVLLGNWYLYGRGSVSRNTSTACNLYLQAANDGVPEGMQNYAANCTSSSSTKNQYYQMAFQAYQRQVNEGKPEGMYNLAYLYENGLGTTRSTSNANYYYQMARERGVGN